MDEIWKPVCGYEGLYEVSNNGNVRSLKRKTTSGKTMKFSTNKDGYYRVHLCKNGKTRTLFVHRVVAMAFIKNVDSGKNIVNHRNEVKTDNRAENLEWCDVKYNTNYNGATVRRGIAQRTPIYAIKDGKKVFYSGITEAAKSLNVSHGNIVGCLQRRRGRRTLRGYTFEYAREEKENR